MDKKVLISIVTYKSREFIKECLDTLMSQTYPKELHKIIISDNNTTDGTIKFIRANYPEIEIMENKVNLGFSGGHNIIFNKAIRKGCDYVAVVNYDTSFDKDWLSQLVTVASKNEMIGSVQARMMLHGQDNVINSCGNMIHFLGFGFTSCYQKKLCHDTCKDDKEIAYASGASVLYNMKAIKEIGGFDEEMFAYHEDTDLGWRLKSAGYKNVLARWAIMYHKYEFARSILSYYYIERNRLLLMLQNYKIKTLLLIFPAIFVMESGQIIFAVKNGYLKQRLRIIYYFLKVSTWKKIIKKRKTVKTLRKLRDKEIIENFVSVIVFQEVENFLLKNIANPFMKIYWVIAKKFIVW